MQVLAQVSTVLQRNNSLDFHKVKSKMLNISKYQKAIAGYSAIAAMSVLAVAQSASAQVSLPSGFNSNSTGGNTTTNPAPPVAPNTPVAPGFSPTVINRASSLNSNITTAQQALTAAQQQVQAATAPVTPTVESPQRFSRVADAADCGCPNADTTASAPAAPANSAELDAAKAAEAAAAEKLAAAKAEARQFIEEANKGSGSTVSVIW
jgi:hypothetical protein